jgi:hypothetical protein
MAGADKRYFQKTDCVSREIAGEVIVVPIRGHVGDLDSVYTLNELGARIWRMLDGQTSVARIAETVAAEYEVTADAAAKDAEEFLGTLEAAGLIGAAPEGAK